ncbi:MAG: hypothetical protein LBR81_01030 [Prevotellaceae bacterium]|nr:hypothetical protein [Prevotellaceae bacterium]
MTVGYEELRRSNRTTTARHCEEERQSNLATTMRHCEEERRSNLAKQEWIASYLAMTDTTNGS